MSRNENPPLDRGQTWFETGATISSTDITDTDYLRGKEWVFEDLDYASTNLVKPVRSGISVRCRLVRNTGAAALLPKRLVTFSTTAGEYGLCVNGYARTTAQLCFPLDEFLPAAGLAVSDIGWIVMEGPAIVTTPLVGDATNVISVGDRLVSLTAATSGATTAGRATAIDLTGATALLGNQVLDTFGQAMSAKTTGQTGGDVLVNINRF